MIGPSPSCLYDKAGIWLLGLLSCRTDPQREQFPSMPRETLSGSQRSKDPSGAVSLNNSIVKQKPIICLDWGGGNKEQKEKEKRKTNMKQMVERKRNKWKLN